MENVHILFIIVFIVVFIKLSDLGRKLKRKTGFLEDEVQLLKSEFEKLHEKVHSPGEGAFEKPAEAAMDEPLPDIEPPAVVEIVEEVGVEPPPVPDFDFTFDEPEVAVTTDKKEKITIDPFVEDIARKQQKPESELLAQWQKFKANVDWELFAGAKLFNWIGGVAAFVFVVLLLKYSVDRNWLPPGLRLAASALVGIGLVFFSEKFRKSNFSILRHTLTAAGIGILYTVVFTATLYYSFLPKPAGFALLVLISATAFVLAVYQQGLTVSVLGALGAYATPLMVSTGSGNLMLLFVYLAIVNTGLFKVSEKLKSPGLLLTGTAGTLITLGLAVFDLFPHQSGYVISGVWAANMVLFTAFLIRQNGNPEEKKMVLWNGMVLYLSSIILAFILTAGKAGWHPFFLITVSIIAAIILANTQKGWLSKVIPYSVMTFIPAAFWVLTRFDVEGFSVSYILILVYGAAGCLGPVMLVKRYGQTGLILKWFNVFPVAVSLLCLAGLYQNPACSFFFWPMMLGLQVIGIGISLLFRAFIQVLILIVVFVLGGLFWMTHIPPDAMGLGFFAFILAGGGLLTGAIIFAAGKLPELLKSINLEQQAGKGSGLPEKWLTAAPAAGVFVLIGAAFFVKHPHFPHTGMVTLSCFLFLSLFFSRRICFEPAGVVALIASVVAQAVWILNPENDFAILFSAVSWSFALFLVSLSAPFLFFRDMGKWKRLWNAWAVYEVLQALFVFYAVKRYWVHPLSNWAPFVMVMLKLPLVAVLLKRLNGKTERNSVLAFHGGALLFYVSILPVLLLNQGWIGLALVFEATALLWLNRRIEHPGLRKTAIVMAPSGLVWLLVSLPALKGVDSLPVANAAVFALAAAVISLGAAVKFAGYPERKIKRLDVPDYFLWLALGAGFYLLNFIIADIFATPGTKYNVFPGRNFIQAALYAITWAGFGAALWRMTRFPMIMRFVGLGILSAGTCWLIGLPVILPEAVAAMNPFINHGLYVFLLLAAILYFSFHKEPWEHQDGRVKNIFLAFFLIALFMLVKLEKSTIFQAGQSFTLFFAHTPSKAVASATGLIVYGTLMLIWPKRLDRPFRIAGLVLVMAAIVKSLIFPFRFKAAFGAMTPLMNFPTLMYLAVLVVLVFFVVRNWKEPWPVVQVLPRPFFAVTLAITAFMIMNVEIAGCLGRGGPFTMAIHGDLAKLFGYSVGWLVFAIGLLAAGIRFSLSISRHAAIALLAITVCKVFLFDIATLGSGLKIIVFCVLSVVLFFVAYLYQRFFSEEKGLDEVENDEKKVL